MKLRELLKKYREPIAYLFWGGATTAVNYGIYFFCTDLLKMNIYVTDIIAWVGAVLFAFVTNKLFVFDSKSWTPTVVLPEFLKFTGARVFSLGLELLLMWIAISLLHLPDGMVKIGVSVLTVLLNYVFSKLFIFRRKKNG